MVQYLCDDPTVLPAYCPTISIQPVPGTTLQVEMFYSCLRMLDPLHTKAAGTAHVSLHPETENFTGSEKESYKPGYHVQIAAFKT
eukprot:2908258-Rhodomonas_salina.3